jgi:hypothetical protein
LRRGRPLKRKGRLGEEKNEANERRADVLHAGRAESVRPSAVRSPRGRAIAAS